MKVQFLRTLFSNILLWTRWRQIWQPGQQQQKLQRLHFVEKICRFCSSRLARSRFDDHADQFSSVVSEVRKQLENFRFLKQNETFPQNVLLTQKPAALTFLPKTFCQSTTIFCSKTGKIIKITFLFSFLYSYSSDIYKTLKILSQKENSKQFFTQNVFNYGYYSVLTSLRNFLDKVPNEHRSNFGKT